MTKYLETKTNSIEEAISSVVLGEKHNYVVIDADGKILGFADDVSQANTMVGREGKAGRAGYNKLTKPIERNQGSKLVGKSYKSITNFLSDKDVKFMSKKMKEEIDEKFSITLPPVRGGKKLLNIEMGRAIRMLKDFGATKSDIRNVLSDNYYVKHILGYFTLLIFVYLENQLILSHCLFQKSRLFSIDCL